MTRAVNGAHSTLNVTAIAFDTPNVALIPGEWVTDGTYHYPVTACSKTSITIGTAEGQTTAGLRATLTDNAVLTREDYYAPIDFDNVLAALNKSDITDDGEKAEIYKAAFMARQDIEAVVGYVKARSVTRKFSMSHTSQYLFMPELRIDSVTSVTINDTVIDTDTYELNQDRGFIFYTDGFFPAGVEHIEVTYSPGWQTPLSIVRFYIMQTRLNYALSTGGLDMQIFADRPVSGGGSKRTLRNPDDVQRVINDGLRQFVKVNV